MEISIWFFSQYFILGILSLKSSYIDSELEENWHIDSVNEKNLGILIKFTYEEYHGILIQLGKKIMANWFSWGSKSWPNFSVALGRKSWHIESVGEENHGIQSQLGKKIMAYWVSWGRESWHIESVGEEIHGILSQLGRISWQIKSVGKENRGILSQLGTKIMSY